MIGAIGSVSSVSPLQYVRRAAAADEAFRIPESALRTNEVAPLAAPAAERDPVVDSVELSRDFPQMIMGATYAPPPVDQMTGLSRGGNARGLSEERDAASGYSEPEELAAEAEDPEAETGAAAGTAGETAEGTAEGENEGEPAKLGEERDANGEALDEGEQRQLQELKSRDREVRAHEQAHKSVGGSLSGGISFEYQQGPDGQKYAVGGEVSIDTSPEKTPEATVAKMQQVKAAAMAPAQPSEQDMSVAAQATQTEARARQQMAQENAPGAAEESGAAGESGATGAAENAIPGMPPANEAAPAPASSAPFGGVASLSSPAANSFMNRYAGSAYGAQSFAASALSMSGYAPVNIVA